MTDHYDVFLSYSHNDLEEYLKDRLAVMMGGRTAERLLLGGFVSVGLSCGRLERLHERRAETIAGWPF